MSIELVNTLMQDKIIKMIEIVRVSNDAEIEGIRLLQKENLKKLISTEEATKEGFVTAEYSF